MQILCEGSEKEIKRLKVFKSICKSFDKNNSMEVFMGWSDIKFIKMIRSLSLLKSKFYFLHKYYLPVVENYTLATSENNFQFSSIVRNKNVYGVQFHPEKSHNYGINFFKNFINLK